MSAAAADALSDVEIRRSGVHGLGVFALRRIPRDTVIGPYAGRRLAADEVAGRDWNQELTYAFGLSDGSVIDGAEGGNAMRHINHSCEPNCVAFEIDGDDGTPQVQIEALGDIDAGAELFLDYCLQEVDGSPVDHPCSCGAATCRGTLAAPA